MATTGVTTDRQKESHVERTAKEPRKQEIHEVKLSRIDQVNKRVRLLHLELQSGPVTFLPGQWLDTFVPGIPKAGGFTITSAPSAAQGPSPYLELAVQDSPENPPAAWLWHPRDEILGSTLRVRIGGSFVFPPLEDINVDHIQRVVFVAGGVGVNPLMSMLSYLAEEPRWRDTEIVLLYSSKLSENDDLSKILFLDRVSKLFGQGKLNGQVRLFLTSAGAVAGRHHVIGAQLEVQSRRISADDLRDAVGSKHRGSTVVYICGPPTMTDELVETITSADGLGLDARHVLTEKWW